MTALDTPASNLVARLTQELGSDRVITASAALADLSRDQLRVRRAFRAEQQPAMPLAADTGFRRRCREHAERRYSWERHVAALEGALESESGTRR